jgi:hypothetical protein
MYYTKYYTSKDVKVLYCISLSTNSFLTALLCFPFKYVSVSEPRITSLEILG